MQPNFSKKKILIFTLIILLISVLLGFFNLRNQPKTINVVFRIDDFSTNTNTEIEKRLINLFKATGGSITFGVIPFTLDSENEQKLIPLSNEKIEILKNGIRDGVIDIGLHGFTHENNNLENRSEFDGVSYHDQFKKINEGKKLLETELDYPITTFLPPWNTYDKNTLKALENLEFSLISAYKKGDFLEDISLSYLPWTCFASELKESVISARKTSVDQPVIVVLLHNYDFMEIDQTKGFTTFKEFTELMEWLSQQQDVNIISIKQASTIISDLSVKRYIASQNQPPLNSFILSSSGEKELSKYLYPEKDIPSIIWIKVIAYYFAYFLTGILITFYFIKLTISKNMKFLRILVFASLIITMSLLVYAFYDSHVYKKAMIIISGWVGITIGLLISYFNAKKIENYYKG